MLDTTGGTMFPTNLSTPTFGAYGRAEALGTWRAAALLVSTRWHAFREAEPETRPWAFAAYVAALDAEEAAAADMAGLYSRKAA
jgi:hypothetical protein